MERDRFSQVEIAVPFDKEIFEYSYRKILAKWIAPLKTFRLFRKFSGRANQTSLSIYIPTEIFGFFGKW